MKGLIAAFGVSIGLVSGTISAAPILYSFTTGPALPFAGSFPSNSTNQAVANTLVPLFAGSSVSGTFLYDGAATFNSTASDGGSLYGVAPPAGVRSFYQFEAQLSGGTVSGSTITDPGGFVVVSNDQPSLSGNDRLQYFVDSSFAASAFRNSVGFTVGQFSFFNLRMFWFEGQSVPEFIPDFLNDQSLPGAPPSFHGRLAIDMVQTTNPSGPQYVLFFDSLRVTAVPVSEPGALALFLVGLGAAASKLKRRRRLADNPGA